MPPVPVPQAMHLSLEFWQAILLCSMLIGGFGTMVAFAYRTLRELYELRIKRIETDLADLKASVKDNVGELKASVKEMASNTLRHDEWARHCTMHERQLDKLELAMMDLHKLMAPPATKKGA